MSGMADRPVRWIIDDAAKFVAREVRRERRYDGILLDPPKYGRGPDGEVWHLESDLACVKVSEWQVVIAICSSSEIPDEVEFQATALRVPRKSSPCLVNVPVLSKKAILTFPAIKILSALTVAIRFLVNRSSYTPTATVKTVGSKGDRMAPTMYLF
jgi:hypothetical protein